MHWRLECLAQMLLHPLLQLGCGLLFTIAGASLMLGEAALASAA